MMCTQEGPLAELLNQVWLSQRPLCCDEYDEQQRRPREQALGYRMVEANPRPLVSLVVVDLDDATAGASATWGHAGMMPTIITVNPENQHAHAVWALRHPVPTTEYARRKPLALLHAVTEGLRRSCGGDPGYSGPLMKNPLSPSWQAEVIQREPHYLHGLAEALEASGDMPPRSWRRTKGAKTTGLGRNCSLFDTTRFGAYRYVRALPDRSSESSELLRRHILATALQANQAFPEPLSIEEVGWIAKSIHKWIVTRSHMWTDGAVACEATFIAMQSARGRKSAASKSRTYAEKFQKFASEELGQ